MNMQEYMQGFLENEKKLRLELDDCDAPFCLDCPGCVCQPHEKASYKKAANEQTTTQRP